MTEENLEAWVRRKLEEGKSEEALYKVLDKRGHDPGLVDQVSQELNKVQEEQDFADENPVKESFERGGDDFQNEEVDSSFSPRRFLELGRSVENKEFVQYSIIFVLSVVMGALAAAVLF